MKDVAVRSVFIWDLFSVLFCFYPAAFSSVFNLLITVQLQKRYKGKKCPENIASATIFISLPLHNLLLHSFLKLSFVSNWRNFDLVQNALKILVFEKYESTFLQFWDIKCAGWRQEKRKIENTTALMRQKGAKALKKWEITRAQTNFKTTTTNWQKESP